MRKLIILFMVFALPCIALFGQRFKSARECFTVCLEYKEPPGVCRLSDIKCKSGENAVIKIDDGSKKSGAFLVLGPPSYNTKSSDTFVFEHVKRGVYRILNRYTRMYVTIKDGKDAPGTELVQEPLRSDNSQLFHVKKAFPLKSTSTVLGRQKYWESGASNVTAYTITSFNGYRWGLWKSTRNWGTHIRLTSKTEGYTPLWYMLPRKK